MSKDPRPRKSATPARRPPAAARATPAWLVAACQWSPAAALALLVVAMRGSMPGTPVADDYAFLDRLAFERPLDLLGSMGAAFYWRPLSRQLWFSLVGPALLRSPWIAAAANALALLALAFVLARIVRSLPWTSAARGAAVAGLVACAPLASEPVRALVEWPSGIQHLLGALFAALALHEALAGRRVTTALAALAGLLSHESAVFAVALVPFVGAVRAPADRRAWTVLAVAITAVWLALYAVAIAHGVKMPAGGVSGGAIARVPSALQHVFAALAGSETAAPVLQPALVVLGLAAFVLAGLSLRRPEARRGALPALAIALAASAPLASLLPDWNAWRAFLPVTALAAGITVALGSVRLELAAAFVVVRLVAMGAAEVPGPVAAKAPAAVSDLSYVRLVRLQRVVDGTRPLVEAAQLPAHSRVGYWGLPRFAEVGFQQNLAVRVWRRDSTLTFGPFGGLAGFEHPPGLTVGYNLLSNRKPVKVVPAAIDAYRRGMAAVQANRSAEGDSLYQLAVTLQPDSADALTGQSILSRALLAIQDGHPVVADSLNRLSRSYQGIAPESLGIDAWLALERGNLALARGSLEDLLAMSPKNELGLQLARELERLERESGTH